MTKFKNLYSSKNNNEKISMFIIFNFVVYESFLCNFIEKERENCI